MPKKLIGNSARMPGRRRGHVPFGSALVLGAILCAVTACGTSSRPVGATFTRTVASVGVVAGPRSDGAGTRVLYVRPTTADGELKPDYRVTKTSTGAECPQTGSLLMGGDVYACHVGSGRYDPCWPGGALGAARQVYCMFVPWSREVTELRVTAPPHPLSGRSSPGPSLWGLELSDGMRCRALLGTSGKFHGTFVTFGCLHGNPYPYLLGAPTKTNGAWRIRIAYWHQGDGGTEGHYTYGPLAKILVAWYGINNAENA